MFKLIAVVVIALAAGVAPSSHTVEHTDVAAVFTVSGASGSLA